MRERSPRPSVIVTADDFGFRPDWDRAIERSVREGFVGSVSIVTTGATYEAARAFVRAHTIDHGVHLDLLDGSAATNVFERAGWVDGRGAFRGPLARFLALYALGRISVAAIACEWRAQLERAFQDGLTPSHLNAHYHLHQLPPLLGVVADLAESFGVPWIRLADEPPWHADGPAAAVKTGVLAALALVGRRRAGARRIGFVRSRGIAASARLDVRSFDRVLDRLSPGTTEIVVHPGQSPAQDAALRSRSIEARLEAIARRTTFRALARDAA